MNPWKKIKIPGKMWRMIILVLEIKFGELTRESEKKQRIMLALADLTRWIKHPAFNASQSTYLSCSFSLT